MRNRKKVVAHARQGETFRLMAKAYTDGDLAAKADIDRSLEAFK